MVVVWTLSLVSPATYHGFTSPWLLGVLGYGVPLGVVSRICQDRTWWSTPSRPRSLRYCHNRLGNGWHSRNSPSNGTNCGGGQRGPYTSCAAFSWTNWVLKDCHRGYPLKDTLQKSRISYRRDCRRLVPSSDPNTVFPRFPPTYQPWESRSLRGLRRI